MRLLNEKNEKNSINVLTKHDITHDMRIKTKVVYRMLIWAFTFLRGARGEGARLGRRRYFWCVSLHSWSIFVQARRKRRFEEISGKKTNPNSLFDDFGFEEKP